MADCSIYAVDLLTVAYAKYSYPAGYEKKALFIRNTLS